MSFISRLWLGPSFGLIRSEFGWLLSKTRSFLLASTLFSKPSRQLQFRPWRYAEAGSGYKQGRETIDMESACLRWTYLVDGEGMREGP